MITLQALANLAAEFGAHRVAFPAVQEFHLSARVIGGDEPALLATVNLSRDSTYRESCCRALLPGWCQSPSNSRGGQRCRRASSDVND